VNSTVILAFCDNKIAEATITMGAVAPTIIRATDAEEFLLGKELSESVITQAGNIAATSSKPIDDIRGSANFRRHMIGISIQRSLRELISVSWRTGVPDEPILLQSGQQKARLHTADKPLDIFQPSNLIITTINGKEYSFYDCQAKTLLNLLREDAGLPGTKEGCAEGECGACTVFLDGKAVMACLIPAPCAHNSAITTIEGIARGKRMNPVQKAFVEEGAVQCGYCTPGFIMSGTKLLEEKTTPSHDDILTALSGNLCRCTGYYKIIRAIESAQRSSQKLG